VSIKRLNKFFQTADIDKTVLTRDADDGKVIAIDVLVLLKLCCLLVKHCR